MNTRESWERIKYLLGPDMMPHSECGAALFSIGYGLWLFLPGETLWMSAVPLQETSWACLFVLAGLSQLLGVVRRHLAWRRANAVAMGLLWACIWAIYFPTFPVATTVYLSSVLCLASGWGYITLSRARPPYRSLSQSAATLFW